VQTGGGQVTFPDSQNNNDFAIIEDNDLSIDQILAITGISIGLGETASIGLDAFNQWETLFGFGQVPDVIITDSQLIIGDVVINGSTSGLIIFDMDTVTNPSIATSVTINAGLTVDGAGVGSSFVNIVGGSLTINAGLATAGAAGNGAIGTTNALVLEVDVVNIPTNGSDPINITDVNTTSTTYDIGGTLVAGLVAITSNTGGNFVFAGLASSDILIINGLGGSITDSGTLTISGASSFTTTDAIIELNDASNSFGDLTLVSGNGTITIVEDDPINLASVITTGGLNVTSAGASAGDISDSGTIEVGGTTTLSTLATTDITLNSPLNDFGGAVTVTQANDVILVDENSLTLGAITTSNSGILDIDTTGAVDFTGTATVAGTLNVDTNESGGTGGDITDMGGTLLITGTTTLDAGATFDIILDNTANDFSTVTITSVKDAVINDTNSLILGAITTSNNGTLMSSTKAGITVSGAILADGAVTLDADNDNTGAGTFDLTGNSITVANDNNLTITATDFVFTGSTLSIGAGTLTLNITQNKDLCLGIATTTTCTGGIDLNNTELDTLTTASTSNSLSLATGGAIFAEDALFPMNSIISLSGDTIDTSDENGSGAPPQ